MCVDQLSRSTTYLLATINPIYCFTSFLSGKKVGHLLKFKWYFTNCYKLKMLSLNKTKTFLWS